MKTFYILLIGLMVAVGCFASEYSEEKSNRIEVLDDYTIKVIETTTTFKDGISVGRSQHFYMYNPTADVSDAIPQVQGVAAVLWTDDVKKQFIEKYKKLYSAPAATEEEYPLDIEVIFDEVGHVE